MVESTRATRELIDRLLLERISLAGIARAVQVSEQWLQTYVNEKYASVSTETEIITQPFKKIPRLQQGSALMERMAVKPSVSKL